MVESSPSRRGRRFWQKCSARRLLLAESLWELPRGLAALDLLSSSGARPCS
jgi:hypothetical protein